MFRNYLIVAVRNLLRQKLYAFINVFGLAIGLAYGSTMPSTRILTGFFG